MLQRLIRLAATQPELLAEHAGAYAALATLEATALAVRLRRQALLHAAALSGLAVAGTLAGMALLLWAALPLAAMPMPGLLIVVPALPALLGLACFWRAQSQTHETAFVGVQRQWQADTAMLHDVGVTR